jgi:hypothetical protein
MERNMKEYIEREEAIKELELKFTRLALGKTADEYEEEYKVGGIDARRIDIDTIKNLPTADVEPVRHGRWLDMYSFDAHYQPIYQCSECGKQVADNYISCHKYCLHCGAKMDRGNK